ncbi:hypothetical protein [Parasphingorhabdus sp.]|uniref:hypothetical protein n=1 Tax=Parasphingorhabdus sp. TaxID=2709688 RepID=UPI003A957307
MARKIGDPSILKARLEAALKQAKPRDIASAQPMAEIVGMTWAGFRNNHISPDAKFPVKTRGAEGKQWEFQVVKVLKYMIKICDKKIAANTHRNNRNSEMVGITVPDEESGSDIAEISKLTDLTLKVQQVRERQGLYVTAEKLSDFLTGYNSTVINGILGVTNQVDPTGLLPASTRKEMDDLLRSLAVSVQASAVKYIEGINANIRKGGTS